MKVIAVCVGLATSQVVFLGKSNISDATLSAKTHCSKVGSDFDDNALVEANNRTQFVWSEIDYDEDEFQYELDMDIFGRTKENFNLAISHLRTEMSRDAPQVPDGGFDDFFSVVVDAFKLVPGASELVIMEKYCANGYKAVMAMFAAKPSNQACQACLNQDYWTMLDTIQDKNFDITSAYQSQTFAVRAAYAKDLHACTGSASCIDNVNTAHYDLVTMLLRNVHSVNFFTVEVFGKLMRGLNPPITINHWQGLEESSRCAAVPADGFTLCGRGAFKDDLATLKALVEYGGGCISSLEVPFYCGQYKASWTGSGLDGGCKYKVSQVPTREFCTEMDWIWIRTHDDMRTSASMFEKDTGC